MLNIGSVLVPLPFSRPDDQKRIALLDVFALLFFIWVRYYDYAFCFKSKLTYGYTRPSSHTNFGVPLYFIFLLLLKCLNSCCTRILYKQLLFTNNITTETQLSIIFTSYHIAKHVLSLRFTTTSSWASTVVHFGPSIPHEIGERVYYGQLYACMNLFAFE